MSADRVSNYPGTANTNECRGYIIRHTSGVETGSGVELTAISGDLPTGFPSPRSASSRFLRRDHASRPQVGPQGSRNHTIGEVPGPRAWVRGCFLKVDRVGLGAGRVLRKADRRFRVTVVARHIICGKSARTDLYGGLWATKVPTVTRKTPASPPPPHPRNPKLSRNRST